MARLAWVIGAVLSVAAVPAACVIVDDGPGGVRHVPAADAGVSQQDDCNPVSGAGCPEAYACDYDNSSGFFTCFGPPNTAKPCDDCDNATTFCGSDSTCLLSSGAATGVCYRFCCTDDDCGAGGACDIALAATYFNLALPSDKVGVCTQGAEGPACNPPAAAPSAGSCVGGFPGKGPGDGGTGDSGTGDGGTGDGGTGDGGTDDGGAGDGGTGDGGNPPGDGGDGG